ncbi:conjugative transposon protein TraM [Alistipes putredinis]|uniref:conjugative transposon protein TraM n=1 Tax=Alistipes putredinis TaxID=28117 RepID=UPI003993E5EF
MYLSHDDRDGRQEVPLRLTESMRAGGVLIPANTVLTGTARIDGERMMITVSAVQYRGSVIPVELLVYDMDGGEGISVPASDEISAVKEIAANAGSGLGSSITITDDAGTQLLSDLGRSVIQGTAQYVGQKMRQVKVTLKAGYRVLLLPRWNNTQATEYP